MRKTVVAAIAALLGMGVSAHAADIYDGSLKDEPVVYAPAPIWAGLYVGGHVGGLWNDGGDSELYKRRKDGSCQPQIPYAVNTTSGGCQHCCDRKDFVWGEWEPWEKLAGATFDEDDELSFVGGVHVGYNWQDGARVFGIEGDVSFSDGLDYLASLRARLGHAWDDMLIYATAGVAFAGFEDKTIHAHYGSHDFDMDISGDREVGFVVGGGLERKVSSNVSVGLEGLYYFFDDTENSQKFGPWCDIGCYSASCVEKKLTHEDDNDLFVVRARLSYHLQGGEPSLEPYK